MKNKIINLTVKCNINNTIIHAAGPKNKNIVLSTGNIGFKGAKRSSKYAGRRIAEIMGGKLRENQLTRVVLIFKGNGKSRKAIIKGLKKRKIKIQNILDNTEIAHNGCRLKKTRRL
jgi:small subunit ribosomal protein S11